MQRRRRIRLCSTSSKAKGAFCSCVAWGWRIYNIVESESDPLTRRPVDLFEKEPLMGKWEVHLHTPTEFGEDPSKDLGGDREQTHKQTNKRCSNYSMMKRDSASKQTNKIRTDEKNKLCSVTLIWRYFILSTDTISKKPHKECRTGDDLHSMQYNISQHRY